MSSGSYFTIYRKYNAKASDETFDEVCNAYLDERKANSLTKKSDEDIKSSLPLVLDCSYGIKESVYDESTKKWKDIKDYSIDGQRKKYLSILKSDHSYLDSLVSWNFGSGFTCLKDEWNLSGYDGRSEYIVSKLEAEKILQACKYLLSGNWSDEFERILSNSWIKTIASGGNSESYWKYVYRNDKKALKGIEYEELNSEYDIDRLMHVMDTYVNIDDDYSSYGKVENILVYTAW